MKANDLFYWIKNAKEKIIVLQGGTSSGKTYAALQAIMAWSIENPQLITTVTAESIPNLKKGALRDSLRIINDNEDLAQYISDYNSTDRLIKFTNSSLAEYTSYENEKSAKSGKRNVLFVNEADSVSYEIYWQLAIRTDFKIIIDYNPTASFWVHEKIIGKPDTILFITDHWDNEFLSDVQHNEIENISDPELWKVYARGMTGQLKATIHSNWIQEKLENFSNDKFNEVIWGIDYGYGTKESSGKTAIIKIGIINPNQLWIRECCYHTGGMDEYQIKEVLEANGWVNGQPFYSEHDPTMISALRRLGIYVLMAQKGERSEWYGIMKIKRFSVHYSVEDENLQWERTHYKWVTVGDIVTNTVEDTRKFHLMAALRYGVYTHFFAE